MGLKEEFLAEARRFVGKHFNEGELAQCAIFIRHCAKGKLPQTAKPYDNVYPLSPGYANSLCGPEIGRSLGHGEPGDLVFFTNTYGDYPPGTITHVGIVSGTNLMIDRSTSSTPVRERSIADTFTPGSVWGFVRPKLWEEDTHEKIKLFFNKNGFKLVVGQDLKKGSYDVEFMESEITI